MRLTLTTPEFCDLVACMLHDHLLHPKEIVAMHTSERWNDLMTVMKNRSMSTILLQYYMSMDPMSRIRYRMMEDVFRDNNKTNSVFLEIRKDHLPAEAKGGIMNVVKKTGKFLAKVVSLGLLDKK